MVKIELKRAYRLVCHAPNPNPVPNPIPNPKRPPFWPMKLSYNPVINFCGLRNCDEDGGWLPGMRDGPGLMKGNESAQVTG